MIIGEPRLQGSCATDHAHWFCGIRQVIVYLPFIKKRYKKTQETLVTKKVSIVLLPILKLWRYRKE